MTFSTVYEESFIDRVYDTCEEHRVTIIDTLICESMILKRQPQYLGSGSSGHSFAVQVGHQRWVLKQYYDDPVVQDIMLREIVQLSSVQNFPCVQRLVGVVPEYLTIVTQYAGEPLHTCITKKLYSPNEFISIMQQVLNAVKYLHSKHILHLNLKPAKICILRDKEGDLRATLIDFGSSHPAGDCIQYWDNSPTTYPSTDPQLFNGEPCHPTNDIYSFGWMLATLLPHVLENNIPENLDLWAKGAQHKDSKKRPTLLELSNLLQCVSFRH
ncbi:serine/threonine-protein kinase 17B-like [Homarus americanus]|uniref:serine/threonine-protein kinase 17B-like n=1 Tax=Homarus americanus TaxID=6706 RepID=UPI001C43E828|nr:serine/threonine-protein kinase 17B-like [Homarus americanus]